MSATVLPFPPVVSKSVPASEPVRPFVPGDLVVLCINATLGLWAAWPVAVVDDDGVVLGVTTPDGRMIGADRVNCDPTCFGVAADDHEPEPFAALRFHTWRDIGDALATFAAISRVKP